MANPAAAIRQQAQDRWPGATVAEWSRRHIKHQHPDDPNKYMTGATVGALHIHGTEKESDTAIQATMGA